MLPAVLSDVRQARETAPVDGGVLPVQERHRRDQTEAEMVADLAAAAVQRAMLVFPATARPVSERREKKLPTIVNGTGEWTVAEADERSFLEAEISVSISATSPPPLEKPLSSAYARNLSRKLLSREEGFIRFVWKHVAYEHVVMVANVVVISIVDVAKMLSTWYPRYRKIYDTVSKCINRKGEEEKNHQNLNRLQTTCFGRAFTHLVACSRHTRAELLLRGFPLVCQRGPRRLHFMRSLRTRKNKSDKKIQCHGVLSYLHTTSISNIYIDVVGHHY